MPHCQCQRFSKSFRTSDLSSSSSGWMGDLWHWDLQHLAPAYQPIYSASGKFRSCSTPDSSSTERFKRIKDNSCIELRSTQAVENCTIPEDQWWILYLILCKEQCSLCRDQELLNYHRREEVGFFCNFCIQSQALPILYSYRNIIFVH